MPTEETAAVAARCTDLVKTYRTASGEVRALKGLSAEVPEAALLAVVGPSGSGKSSLLRLIAGLDRPDGGTLVVEGTDVHDASARTLRRFRRSTVGYLFQRPSDNFLPHLTVGEHLRLASGLTHRPPRIDQDELLSTLGIEHRADHLPSELSGGEQQRAAIAEVLMGGARIVVADEPTAELDSTSAQHVMDTMVALARAGVTFVVATHDRSVMRRADDALELDHGLRRTSHAAAGSHATAEPRRPSSPPTQPERRRRAEPDRAQRWRPPVPDGDVDVDEPASLVPEPTSVLDVVDVSKSYRRGDEVVHALDAVSLTLGSGELVGLIGRSGSGKTTLLNVVAGWEHPDSGTIDRAGSASDVPSWDELAVVPQKLGLFDELTVRENLEYPARLTGRLAELGGRIDELMENLAIGHLAERYPKETSLGEQQRAAVARALVLSPRLVLADEPTGHQDAVSERRVLEAFGRAAAEGASCLIATHNVSLAPRLDRVLEMTDGRLNGSAAAGSGSAELPS